MVSLIFFPQKIILQFRWVRHSQTQVLGGQNKLLIIWVLQCSSASESYEVMKFVCVCVCVSVCVCVCGYCSYSAANFGLALKSVDCKCLRQTLFDTGVDLVLK